MCDVSCVILYESYLHRPHVLNLRFVQGKTMDQLDEYVMVLESHRIKVSKPHSTNCVLVKTHLMLIALCALQLVAKLKSVFDRFDTASDGRLTGSQIEQLLLYMNRPVDSAQVML